MGRLCCGGSCGGFDSALNIEKRIIIIIIITIITIIMSTSELACTYAALILHDDGIPITEEKLNTLISSAGITVEPYWPSLFAKMLAKTSIEDLLMSAGT